MPRTIQVPDNFRRLDLSFDIWKKKWHCWALIDGKEGDSNLFWYYGQGFSPEEATQNLSLKGKHEYDHPPKNLESKGNRHLVEKRIRDEKPLKDLF